MQNIYPPTTSKNTNNQQQSTPKHATPSTNTSTKQSNSSTKQNGNNTPSQNSTPQPTPMPQQVYQPNSGAGMYPQQQGFGDPWGYGGGGYTGYNNWSDPWGDGLYNGGYGGVGSTFSKPGGQNQKKTLTPEERVAMIEKVYEEVVGRKPDTNDINYYKYSSLGEEEIRKQLISGKEHKELITNGREFKNIFNRCTNAESRVKLLESQIRDQLQEFRKLTELLKEKNRYIQQMRQQSNNPYNLPSQQ